MKKLPAAPIPLTALLLGLLLLAGAGFAAWHGLTRLQRAAATLNSAHTALTRLATVQAAVAEAASARRAYLLTGDTTHLDPCRTAGAKAQAQVNDLRPLLAAQAEQYLRLLALGPLLEERLGMLGAAADPRSRGALAMAAQQEATSGQRLQGQVQDALAELQRHAAEALANAHLEADEAALATQGAVAASALLGLLLAALAIQRWLAASAALGRLRALQRADDEAAGRSADTLQSVFDHPAALLCVLDGDGRLRRVGAGLQAVCGWPAEALLGTLFIDKVAAEDRRAAERALDALAGGGAVPPMRQRWRRPDGTTALLQWTLRPLVGGEWLALATDLGELHTLRLTTTRAAEALRLSQAELAEHRSRSEADARWQATLLALLEQALRRPADALLEATRRATLGLAAPSDDAQRRAWAAAAAVAADLHESLADAMDLGRIDAGRLLLRREAFDLWDTLLQPAARAREQAERKGLELQVTLPDDLGYARGDAQRVEQIVQRLLRAAIEATPAGRVTLQAARREGTVQVTVTDGRGEPGAPALQALQAALAGPGATPTGPQQAQPHAPQEGPGGAAPPGASTAFAPATLGLVLAHRLARQMGGGLGVSPVAGTGWSLELLLPADEATQA